MIDARQKEAKEGGRERERRGAATTGDDDDDQMNLSEIKEIVERSNDDETH